MCGVLKECLLQRYFSKVLHITFFLGTLLLVYVLILIYFLKELRSGTQGAESDIIHAFRRVEKSQFQYSVSPSIDIDNNVNKVMTLPHLNHCDPFCEMTVTG